MVALLAFNMNQSTPQDNSSMVAFTDQPLPHRSNVWNTACASIIIIIAIIAIIGNGLVVASSILNEDLRRQASNLLIVNLAVCDLLCGIFVMIPSAISLLENTWCLGNMSCRIHLLILCMLLTASNVTLSTISYDRAIAVTRSLCYHRLMTPKRVKLLIVLAWLYGLAIALTPTICDWITFDYWEGVCSVPWIQNHSWSNNYLIISGVFRFGIPSGLMIIFNARILITVRKLQTVTFRPCAGVNNVLGYRDRGNGIQSFCSETTRKSLKSLYVLIGVYFVCFTPYTIDKLSTAIGGENVLPKWIHLLATIMQFAASACNPFIYAILRKDYRHAFVKFLKQISRKLRT